MLTLSWFMGVLLAAAPLTAAQGEDVLDDFSYADATAARAMWKAAEGTPPVELTEDRPAAVVVTAPFATSPRLGRAVVDRRLTRDLSVPGEFALEIASDQPEALGEITLYFHSGRGWYAAHAALARKGWQTLRFSKAAFRQEETPGGWNQVDAVRIAVWRGQAKDATLRIRRLTGLTHDVAIVMPTGQGSEQQAAQQAASLVAELLEELGLGSDAIDDSALRQGALGSRRVAVLAYHPGLEETSRAALERFVKNGGKLFVCYNLPEPLGDMLGFGRPHYVRQQRPGQFAKIEFTAPDVAGMPKAIAQASWNITEAEPVGHNARAIGRWLDDRGQATGRAALLLSERGAFFSHIVLGDDRPGKRQMLAAILGHLAPPLWPRMAAAELQRALRVGPAESGEELARLLAESKADQAAIQKYRTGMTQLQRAREQVVAKGFAESIARAREAHAALVEAYLLSQPSPRREGRAMWNHSGTGAFPGDWERTIALLAKNGFNMVLPNMLWGGVAHYASDTLPRSETFSRYGDQIAACTKAAARHGVEVHVWKVNFNLAMAPADFVNKLRGEGRTQVDVRGQSLDWLCPSHPANRRLEVESMVEVARKYPVAGLHFDYIRYPGRESCYCDGCRKRFGADTAQTVADWPRDCYTGRQKDAYNQWRCQQITALVAAVASEARKVRPDLKISAAVFGSYPSCRESIAQDWPVWIKAGYLDFVCPMDYTESDLQFASLVENQLKLVGGRVPIYPGIGASASSSTLGPDRVASQVAAARRVGAGGFTIFNLDSGTAGSIVPGLGLGVGRQLAQPPHAGGK